MDLLINFFLFVGLFSLLVSLFLQIFMKRDNYERRVGFIKNFADYRAVLEYHMEKSYDIIHKDRILVYSLEATHIPDKEFNETTLAFMRLVVRMLGPVLYQEYLELYGNEDTFYFLLGDYFNARYENDEIRKNSLDTLTDQSSEET